MTVPDDAISSFNESRGTVASGPSADGAEGNARLRAGAVTARGVVAVDSLRPADSPRLAGINEEHARRLADIDTILPLIIVHRPTMKVVDGMHRLRAAILKGQDTVDVEFFDGSEDDAFILSVQINTAHGLPLTLADRKAAAVRILAAHPELSDRVIAQQTGLAAKTVAGIRRSTGETPRSNTRQGQDGRFRPVNAQEGRYRAVQVIEMKPDASLRQIAKEAGISVATAKDVRDRLRRGESPILPARRSAAASRPTGTRSPNHAKRRRPADEADSQSPSDTLERLKRDPSLRLSGAGRTLLHLLHTHVSVLEKWPELNKAVPAHCTCLIAKLAHQCSDEWDALSRALEKRATLEACGSQGS